MRAVTWSRQSRAAVAAVVAALVGGCRFRPDGDPSADDDDDVTADAAEADASLDAAVTTDARTIDAQPAFDPGACPGSYRVVLGQPSKYRVVGNETWTDAQARCKRDSVEGYTHLAVLGSDGERDGVGLALVATAEYRRLWIGTWNPGPGARTVTGEALYPSTALATGQAVTWVRDVITPFRAESVDVSYAMLCECDGRASQP